MPLVKPDNDHARDEADRGSEAGEAHEEQDESGDDGRVEAGLRRDAGGDAEGHGKRKSDQPDRDAGEQVVEEHLGGVGAQGQNRFGQVRIADGNEDLLLFYAKAVSRVFLCLVETFRVNKGGNAGGVVVLFPSPKTKAVSLIEADGRSVRFGDVKRQDLRAGSRCGGFETVQQFGGDAALAVTGGDLQGLDVGDGLGTFHQPLRDGKAGHLAVFFGDPCGGVGAGDE